MLLITYFFAVVAFLAVRGAALTSTDVSKDEVRGMVTLDATTFSKIIPSDRHATIVMFINKVRNRHCIFPKQSPMKAFF